MTNENENENSRPNAVAALTAQYVQAAVAADPEVLDVDPEYVVDRASRLAETLISRCEDIHEAAAHPAN